MNSFTLFLNDEESLQKVDFFVELYIKNAILFDLMIHPDRAKEGQRQRWWTGNAGKDACRLHTFLSAHISSTLLLNFPQTGYYNMNCKYKVWKTQATF